MPRTPTRIALAIAAGSACLVATAQQQIELADLRSVPAETTAAAATDRSWTAPRTSWGHPSLEGTWSVDDMRGIPAQRPEHMGTRATLDEEEFRQRAAQQQAGRDRAVHTETFLRNEWGTRTFGYSSLVIDPPDGRVPPMTETGRAHAAAMAGRSSFSNGPFNTFEDFSLYDRCITRGIFGSMLPSIYGNGIRIVQSPDAVSITYEMIHETRVIPLDGRPHLDGNIRSYTGNGRGYWDGETLVVKSVGFTDKTRVGGGPHSDQLELEERFTRVDPDMIEYVVHVKDPVNYTAPFAYRVMVTTQPDYYVYEYSCHEGNSAIGGGLAGERAYERRVEEALARGLPVPPRSTSEVYRSPGEEARIFDINAGE